jgi:hypothetical protein
MSGWKYEKKCIHTRAHTHTSNRTHTYAHTHTHTHARTHTHTHTHTHTNTHTHKHRNAWDDGRDMLAVMAFFVAAMGALFEIGRRTEEARAGK